VSREPRRAAVMLDVLEEHFEELDFLWEQRERHIFTPDWTVRQLAELESRAEAHLDGLRIGGEHAVTLAAPFLVGDETGPATAAAFTLLAADPPRADAVIEAACRATAPARTGIRIGLRHAEIAPLTDRLYDLALGRDAALRAFAVDVLAFHRLRAVPELEALFAHEVAEVRRLAYGAVGRLRGQLSERDLEAALGSGDAPLRRVALEAAARSGFSGLAALCRRCARGVQAVPEAIEFLGVVGGPEDLPLLRGALAEPAVAEAALAGLGALGSTMAVPLVLDAMATPTLAGAAAAAFTRITGVEDLTSHGPARDAAGDDEEEGADPARARAVWETLCGRFHPAGRWQGGLDVSTLDLARVLADLPLATRRDVYLGMRVREPSTTPDVELERRVAAARVEPARSRAR
jgi:uncharacterized protein (TIGR02270 family)